jgi:hypothetical protein
MNALVACGKCRRHARVGACPFCGARVVGAPVPSMERRATSRRDVLLFATTLGIVGCGARTGLPEPPPGDAVVDSDLLEDAALADTEFVLDTELDSDIPIIDTSLPSDDGGGVPIYGAAPFQ